MKRKILFSTLALAAVGTFISGLRVFQNQATQRSELLIANIEAIANGETTEELTCYNTITSKDGCKVRYCSTCEYIDGTDPWNAPSSKCIPK